MRRRKIVQAAILWVILLLIFSPLPAQAQEAKQSGTKEDKAESSGMQEDLIGEFDFGEIDDSLKELFPEEKDVYKRQLWIQAIGRLIQNKQIRPASQGYGDSKPLAHAKGKIFRLFLPGIIKTG